MPNRLLHCLLWLLIASGCSEHAREHQDTWEGICLDLDGDGFGFQCERGADCDDQNAAVHEGCARCSKPDEDCPCDEGSEAIDCALDPQLTKRGSLLCKNGKRYCRDEAWTACEGLSSFTIPPPSQLSGAKLQALTGGDAGKSCGYVCNPDCFQAQSDVEAGTGTAVNGGDAGGITVRSTTVTPEAGVILLGDGGLLNDYSCIPGTLPDIDCDRIPDSFDTNAEGPPFQTDNKTIFMTLGPGEQKLQNLALSFNLKSADIYFLLDMTGTMQEERLNLINSLTTGSFLDSSVNCSDRNYDGLPDQDLKSQGVAGNIACLIRDARFGAGWFRDIPFGPYKYSNACSTPCGYSAPDYLMFEHLVDITTDVDAIKTALTGVSNVGAYSGDFPEGGMEALWPLLTAGEVWAGWDRPSTPRRICPAGRWGWGCFRSGAIPIIIHATDDDMHEGPAQDYVSSVNQFPYSDTSYLSLAQGSTVSGSNYMGVFADGEAEDLSDAVDLGDVTNRWVTYAGDTRRMTSDISFAQTGTCGSAWSTTDQSSPDAVFRFTTTATKKITVSTRGSRFDTTVLLTPRPGTLPSVTSFTPTGNATYATAADLGTLGGSGRFIVKGDNSTHASVYAREGLSTGTSGCFYTNVADPFDPAAVVKFRVSQPMSVRLTTSANTTSETALLQGSALQPTGVNLSTIACGSGATGNCNNRVADYSLGDLSGTYYQLYGGTTNVASITNDYSLSCSGGTYGTAPDSVVDFNLSTPRTMLFETGPSGSAALSTGTGFSHGLFVYQKPSNAVTSVRTVIDGTSGTEALATSFTSALDVPATAGSWLSFRGSSALDVPTYTQSQVGGTAANVCHNGNVGADSATKDIVFRFVVTGATPQTFEFETSTPVAADGYKTWLSLHNGTIAPAPVVAASNASEMEVAPGQLLTSSINGKRVLVTNAKMNLRAKNYAASSNYFHPSSVLLGNYCGDAGSKDGRDAVFSFVATSNGTVRIATTDATATPGTQPGFDTFATVFKTSISAANRITGNCPSPGLFSPAPPDARSNGNAWSDSFSVTAGTTYYVVVKEWTFSNALNDTTGSFGLIVEDATYATNFLGCDAGSSLVDSKFSRMLVTLSAGTYYVVLKGSGSGSSTQYALNVRRPPNGLGTDLKGCANSASQRARLQLNLAAGDYSLVMKGQGSNKGAYSVAMRDLAVAPDPIDCRNGSSTVFTTAANLQPGIDYYAVVRGNTTGSPYQLVVEDSSLAATTTATGCDDNGSATPSPTDENALLVQNTLPAGEYYLVVKGKTGSDKGWFQVSVGDDTKIGSGTFAPKKYYGTGGVKENLDSTQTRVITVYSAATSDPGYKQSLTLSAQSGATTNGQSYPVGQAPPAGVTPLTYVIPSDGSGLGAQVVSAVDSLVKALKMNMTVVLSPSPESPPAGKPFAVRVEAYGSTSNCNPTLVDTDANGVVDTFQQCGPGASPNFRVTFENPVANPVPLNPADPNGGYNMTLLLLGNRGVPTGYQGTVVDTIPVYIIPAQLTPPTPVTQYDPSSSYEQSVSAQCTGTETPLWRTLRFTATTPAGTSTDFRACGATTSTNLQSCTLQSVGTLTSSGVACTSSDQLVTCGVGSYCSAVGKCETFRTAVPCTTNLDCGSSGACINVSGTQRCQATSYPIDVSGALDSQQGFPLMRVDINMNSSSDRSKAPTVYDWALDYYCTPGV